MAYERTNWIDGVTPLSATNMNNIEQGIVEMGNFVTATINIALSGANKANKTFRFTSGNFAFECTTDAEGEAVLKIPMTGTYTVTVPSGVYGISTSLAVTIGSTYNLTGYAELNNWEYWCLIGGLTPATYGSLAAVVASAAAMTTLANSALAIDYMIPSTGAIMTAVVGSVNAMTKVGLSSAATTAFIASSAWVTAILASANAITGLDASSPTSVPTMTSNTAPSGVASADTTYASYSPFKAFDKVSTEPSRWVSALAAGTHWLKYQFASAVWAYKFSVICYTGYGFKNCKLQGSADGSTWVDLTSNILLPNDGAWHTYNVSVPVAARYAYYRLIGSDSYSVDGSIYVFELNVYGK